MKELKNVFIGGLVVAMFFTGCILISNFLNYGTFIFR